jgi:hypothetical protein
MVIDSREQEPLQFENLPTVPGTLCAGDYSPCGLEASFAVERKSTDDLANCSLAAQRTSPNTSCTGSAPYFSRRWVPTAHKLTFC